MSKEAIQQVYASGECEIDLVRRKLRIRGVAVPFGERVFEIVEIPARSAGEFVAKGELNNRTWPGAVVLKNTLQVHTSATRKALGHDRSLQKTESGSRLPNAWRMDRPQSRFRDAANWSRTGSHADQHTSEQLSRQRLHAK